ncbi:hypothetical protein [Rhizobium leguminosarum]|uniref:hypothetical protein n=1 Tax=Rhizobium leguminosarum TaxID=384 RepID=UPI003F954CA9
MKSDLIKPHHVKVGSVDVIQKSDREKRNPNSLRFLIAHVINIYFEGNVSLAVEQLQPYGGRYIDDRTDRHAKQINEKNITKILKDEIHIAYWHVEIFSRALGVPSGIFLLISREFSYHRYDITKHGTAIFHDCITKYIDAMRLATKSFDVLNEDSFKAILERSKEAFAPLREDDRTKNMLF